MRSSRQDDARLDALIHDATLRHLGVIEPDEPTDTSHRSWLEIGSKRPNRVNVYGLSCQEIYGMSDDEYTALLRDLAQ